MEHDSRQPDRPEPQQAVPSQEMVELAEAINGGQLTEEINAAVGYDPDLVV